MCRKARKAAVENFGNV